MITPWVRRLALACLLLTLAGCTQLIFQPMRLQVLRPSDLGIDYRDVEIHATDGTPLHAWFLPAQGRPKATILFLHGNAENISTHIGSVWWLPGRGYNVLLLDYRGYGQSAGTPSLAGLHSDTEGALARIDTLEGARGLPVVVFGQSLGGAIAITALARSQYRDKVRALVVEGALSDYHDIAREKLAQSWLTWAFQWPLSYTVDDDYSPKHEIALIAPIPLLIVHGEVDEIVPVHHARVLFDAAREPKELWLVPDVGHIQAFAYPANRDALVRWLDARVDAPAQSQAQ